MQLSASKTTMTDTNIDQVSAIIKITPMQSIIEEYENVKADIQRHFHEKIRDCINAECHFHGVEGIDEVNNLERLRANTRLYEYHIMFACGENVYSLSWRDMLK